MGRRIVWQTPLSPAQVKDVLRENVGAEGISMFAPWWFPSRRGKLPLLGTFNAYAFQVQLQPRMRDPFATFCTASVKADGAGSRLTVVFGFYGLAKFFYFAGFGWSMVVMGLLGGRDGASLGQRLVAPAQVLAAAVAVALFARWRAARDTPVLEEFLARQLQLGAPAAEPPRPAENAA